jgi:hypothetical protein
MANRAAPTPWWLSPATHTADVLLSWQHPLPPSQLAKWPLLRRPEIPFLPFIAFDLQVSIFVWLDEEVQSLLFPTFSGKASETKEAHWPSARYLWAEGLCARVESGFRKAFIMRQEVRSQRPDSGPWSAFLCPSQRSDCEMEMGCSRSPLEKTSPAAWFFNK